MASLMCFVIKQIVCVCSVIKQFSVFLFCFLFFVLFVFLFLFTYLLMYFWRPIELGAIFQAWN